MRQPMMSHHLRLRPLHSSSPKGTVVPKGKPNKQPPSPKQAQSVGQGVSKLEAVRQAISSLGADAKPLQIREFVKSKIGLDLKPRLVATFRSKLSGRSRLSLIKWGADKVRQLAEVLAK